ncbi:phosphotransferase enzyme family protein [Cohnella terricola]|uniref:Phosphotransferase n=1 Tax=Cohnella terricola TaxID=1289167 RepID=A0A559J8W6_9BACL|nr:phosphotransferase [Cohnella terricola]TVX96291.1 phosphotransferase [Cohnella terricola]
MAYRYGKSVATIHLKSVDFETKHDRPLLDLKQLIEEPLKVIKKSLILQINDYNFIESIGKKIITKITELQSEMDWGICHGDLHGGNAHIRADIITHFDFDICGYGWRAYDLAVFKFARELEADKKSGEGNNSNQIWIAFLEGYKSIRNLGQRDIESIPYFCVIRQLWLMKLSLQYFRDLDIVGSVNAIFQ